MNRESNPDSSLEVSQSLLANPLDTKLTKIEYMQSLHKSLKKRESDPNNHCPKTQAANLDPMTLEPFSLSTNLALSSHSHAVLSSKYVDSVANKGSVPRGTRTPDLFVRSEVLYPTEL